MFAENIYTYIQHQLASQPIPSIVRNPSRIHIMRREDKVEAPIDLFYFPLNLYLDASRPLRRITPCF